MALPIVAIDPGDVGFAAEFPTFFSIDGQLTYRDGWSIALEKLKSKDFPSLKDCPSSVSCVTPLKSSGLPGGTPCKHSPTPDARNSHRQAEESCAFLTNPVQVKPQSVFTSSLAARSDEPSLCKQIPVQDAREASTTVSDQSGSGLQSGHQSPQVSEKRCVAALPMVPVMEEAVRLNGDPAPHVSEIMTLANRDCGFYDEVPTLRTAAGSVVHADTMSRKRAHQLMTDASTELLAYEVPEVPQSRNSREYYCAEKVEHTFSPALAPEALEHGAVPVLRTAAGAPVCPEIASVDRARHLLVHTAVEEPSSKFQPHDVSCFPVHRNSTSLCEEQRSLQEQNRPNMLHQIDHMASRPPQRCLPTEASAEHCEGGVPILRTAAGLTVSTSTKSLARAQQFLADVVSNEQVGNVTPMEPPRCSNANINALDEEFNHSNRNSMAAHRQSLHCAGEANRSCSTAGAETSLLRTAAGSMVRADAKSLHKAQHLLLVAASDESSNAQQPAAFASRSDHQLPFEAARGDNQMILSNAGSLLGACARTAFKPPRTTVVAPKVEADAEPLTSFGVAARKQFKRPRVASSIPVHGTV